MPGRSTLTLLAFGVLLLGCASGPTPPSAVVSLEEARGFLARIVNAAQSGNLDAICQIADGGNGNCRQYLKDAPAGSAPHLPPVVYGFRTIPTTDRQTGGTVLGLCGVDGLGQPYRSEILIFRWGQGLQAINAVYWRSGGIAQAGDTTAIEPAATGGC
jgi:hypothetical protein